MSFIGEDESAHDLNVHLRWTSVQNDSSFKKEY